MRQGRLDTTVLRGQARRLAWIAIAAVVILVPTISTMAAPSPVRETNQPGFGDRENSFSWSMAWFKGNLYVGTVRDEQCVEYATFDYYNLRKYTTNPSPGVTCPADRYDMDLRAEIWRYTPSSNSTGSWTRVYQSPTIPNPRAPGKEIARDIGYRGMTVMDAGGGEQYLYVGAVTAGSYIPELNDTAPPRILRTTDGVNFTALNGAPDKIYTVHDPVNGEKPIGYRALTAYDGRLFITATSGFAGDGVVVEVGDPTSGSPTFTQVTPAGVQVFDMDAFNSELYIGIGDKTDGYGVWRTDATGPAPFNWVHVVDNGAGRGAEITSVVSMHVFDNRLYVGASGWYNNFFPASELIRIAPDDSWEVVVGKARQTTEGLLKPISGLPDGFGNVFNAHFWRMQDLNNGLYLGTNDWSWQLQTIPAIRALLGWQFGFDVYGSCNGQFWYLVTANAFGDGQYNFGARTMANTPYGGFIGSANQAQGTVVFATNGTQGVPKCGGFSISDYWSNPFSSVTASGNGPLNRIFKAPSVSGAFDPNSSTSAPSLLQADIQQHGTVLSWDPAQGAKRYRIYRAMYLPNAQVGVPAPQKLPGQENSDLPIEVGPATGSPAPGVNILGDFVSIGTTTDPYYVDSNTRAGVTYAYKVRAESGVQVSSDSNIVVASADSPVSNFESVASTISSLAAKGQMSQDTADSLTASLSTAKSQNDQGHLQDALTTLGTMIQTVRPGSGVIADDVYAEELSTELSSLQRSIALANIAQQSSSTGGGRSSSPTPTEPPQPVTNTWGTLSYPPFENGFSAFSRNW